METCLLLFRRCFQASFWSLAAFLLHPLRRFKLSLCMLSCFIIFQTCWIQVFGSPIVSPWIPTWIPTWRTVGVITSLPRASLDLGVKRLDRGWGWGDDRTSVPLVTSVFLQRPNSCGFGDVEYLGYFECLHFHDLMLGEKKICVPWIQKSYGRCSTDPALQFKMWMALISIAASSKNTKKGTWESSSSVSKYLIGCVLQDVQ